MGDFVLLLLLAGPYAQPVLVALEVGRRPRAPLGVWLLLTGVWLALLSVVLLTGLFPMGNGVVSACAAWLRIGSARALVSTLFVGVVWTVFAWAPYLVLVLASGTPEPGGVGGSSSRGGLQPRCLITGTVWRVPSRRPSRGRIAAGTSARGRSR